MLTTVKAEVEVGGNVRLLEPLEVSKPTKALVTLLEENADPKSASSVLDFLRSARLPKEAKPSSEEITAQIEEARNSWD